MSILLPVLAPLSGGVAFTIAALCVLAIDPITNNRAPRPAAGAELVDQ